MKVVLAGPSGSGKTTLKNLFLENSSFVFLKSYTTRLPRNDNDSEYTFITVEDFENKIAQDYFFEYENIFNNYYGLSKAIFHHIDVILTLDVKGALKMKHHFQRDCLCIMILPPSMQILKNRMLLRGCKDIEMRLARAQEEVSHIKSFDYVLINDDLSNTLQQLKNIISVVAYQNQCAKQALELFNGFKRTTHS